MIFANAKQYHIFQTYPTNFIMILICIMAMIYNLPRLFDTQSTYQSHKFVQRIGNSGDSTKDFRIIVVSIFIRYYCNITEYKIREIRRRLLHPSVDFSSHVLVVFDKIASVYCSYCSYTLHN